MTRDRLLVAAIPAGLVLLGAAVRFAALGQPDQIVFDETYYVRDAQSYLAHGAEEGFAVHPPLGKWLIAVGIGFLGESPAGWRVSAAIAGTLVVLVTYLTARRLLPGLAPAALAGVLVAADGLLLVQSRIAMLDIFLALFVVLTAWLLLADRDDLRDRGPDIPLRERRWLLLAGVTIGAAIATKWSGVLALGAAGLVVLGYEIAARRATGSWRSRPRAGLAAVAIGLVLIPAGTYLATHLPWLAGYPVTHEARTTHCLVDDVVLDPCPVGVTERVAGLARHHRAVWRFHRDLEAEHPYKSHAWTWPLMIRPINYHWESCPPERAEEDPDLCVVAPGNAAQIIALGNPALWWSAVLAALVLAAGLIRRDGRAAFILAFWAAQYVPWLVVGRPLFFFYMTPVVAFMALGVAYACVALDAASPPDRPRWRRPGTIAGIVVATSALVLIAYFYPVLTGREMDEGAVRDRWWFNTWV